MCSEYAEGACPSAGANGFLLHFVSFVLFVVIFLSRYDLLSLSENKPAYFHRPEDLLPRGVRIQSTPKGTRLLDISMLDQGFYRGKSTDD